MSEITLFGVPLIAATSIGVAIFILMKRLPIPEFLKRIRILFAIVFGVGCGIYVLAASVTIDNREKIAMAILAPEVDKTIPSFLPHPSPSLTGALNGKFPQGTDVENLKSFIKKLGGNCHQSQPGQPVLCTMSESGTFCIERSISITAKTNNLNKIEGIDATRITLAC